MFEYLLLPLIYAKKRSRCKGGGGGAEDWFTEGQSPNYDSARFTKGCNINEIQRFAKIPETTRD